MKRRRKRGLGLAIEHHEHKAREHAERAHFSAHEAVMAVRRNDCDSALDHVQLAAHHIGEAEAHSESMMVARPTYLRDANGAVVSARGHFRRACLRR